MYVLALNIDWIFLHELINVCSASKMVNDELVILPCAEYFECSGCTISLIQKYCCYIGRGIFDRVYITCHLSVCTSTQSTSTLTPRLWVHDYILILFISSLVFLYFIFSYSVIWNMCAVPILSRFSIVSSGSVLVFWFVWASWLSVRVGLCLCLRCNCCRCCHSVLRHVNVLIVWGCYMTYQSAVSVSVSAVTAVGVVIVCCDMSMFW